MTCDKKGKCSDKCPDFCKAKYKRIYCCEKDTCNKNSCGCDCARIDMDVVVTPAFVTKVGESVTFEYRLRNTGSVNLCNGLMVCSKLNGKLTITDKGDAMLPARGYRDTFVPLRAVYQVTKDDMTSGKGFVEDKAYAFALVNKCRGVHSLEVKTRVETTGADLVGHMNQVVDALNVTADVSITNMSTSVVAGENVRLDLPYPNGVTEDIVTLTAPIAAGFTKDATGLHIVAGTLAAGVTNTYNFTYTVVAPPAPTIFAWTGVVTTDTHDPNPENNYILSRALVQP